ncbi:nitroreductase family protein [Andreesenia angusta]|nr:nitroreductase family protein [Andreesenia angusta]
MGDIKMDAITAISERKGIKKFHDQSLPKVIIENILDLATKAPSCKNRQPWKFAIVQGDMILELKDLVESSPKDLDIDLTCVENASAVIFVFNRLSRTEDDYSENKLIMDSLSIGSAIQNILLVSETFKLGSLLVSDFIELGDEVAEWLGESDQLVSGILIGFPDENPKGRPKVHYSEVSKWYE